MPLVPFLFPYESCREIEDRAVLISRFEEQSEQRRQVTSKKLIGFQLRSPNLTKAQALEYRQFYRDRNGSLDPFTFGWLDETLTVRFDGPMNIDHEAGLYRASFNFQVIDQSEAT